MTPVARCNFGHALPSMFNECYRLHCFAFLSEYEIVSPKSILNFHDVSYCYTFQVEKSFNEVSYALVNSK